MICYDKWILSFYGFTYKQQLILLPKATTRNTNSGSMLFAKTK